jgi:FkbM family methyltransferase
MDLWALRGLGKSAALRKAAKVGFSAYFRSGVVRKVAAGPLRGAYWFCGADQQFWMPLGMYEPATAAWLGREIAPGAVFFDIGANAGYFTLLGAKLAGASGTVVAFEPTPHQAHSVRAQAAINQLDCVRVEQAALSNQAGEAEFTVEKNGANSHFQATPLQHASHDPAQTIRVKTRTLDDFVAASGLTPNVLKIDVEGAEMLVLDGASHVLTTHRPRAIVSTHSDALKASVAARFRELGYEVQPLAGFTHELCCYPS